MLHRQEESFTQERGRTWSVAEIREVNRWIQEKLYFAARFVDIGRESRQNSVVVSVLLVPNVWEALDIVNTGSSKVKNLFCQGMGSMATCSVKDNSAGDNEILYRKRPIKPTRIQSEPVSSQIWTGSLLKGKGGKNSSFSKMIHVPSCAPESSWIHTWANTQLPE